MSEGGVRNLGRNDSKVTPIYFWFEVIRAHNLKDVKEAHNFYKHSSIIISCNRVVVVRYNR